MTLRKRLLARVHILKSELNWDEDEYRDFIFSETGKNSAGDLDYIVLESIVRRMEALRRNRKAAAVAAAGDPAFDNTALVKKCYALAFHLTAAGDPAAASARATNYLDATASKICTSKDWRTATAGDLTKLVAALSIEKTKRTNR